ncbi:uncharacterized protein [Lepeophtheirus salmonis]|uniref:Uncharacterized protein n=1 Tax=Lepeophtheirus salmonis TaxID=72036 RepID=A0A0K2UQN7_LEPSM|nr:uncharacterized protein LOC121128602 [Lepeophtheirus salmonis]
MGDSSKVLSKDWTAPPKKLPNEKKIWFLRMLKRFIYVFLLFGLTLILLLQSAQCLAKYLDHPTYMSSTIVDQTESEFPALTVCPNIKGYKPEVLAANGFAEEADYNDAVDGRKIRWTSNNSDVSPLQLYDTASYTLNELVGQFYIRYFCKIAGIFGKEIPVRQDNPRMFTEQRHRSYGKCYTIYPGYQLKVKERAVYYMHLKFKEPILFYLHKTGQFLDLSGRMAYHVNIGERIETQVNYQDARMLIKTKPNGLKTCSNDDYDTCMYNAMARHMYGAVNCAVPFIRNNSRICETPYQTNMTFWMFYNRVTNQMKDCLDPCSFLIINVGAKNYKTINESYGELLLYYAPKVMLSQEHYLYQVLSLLAEIGGYVGLLLGVSFFHVTGIINEVIDRKIHAYEVEGRLTPVIPIST